MLEFQSRFSQNFVHNKIGKECLNTATAVDIFFGNSGLIQIYLNKYSYPN